MSDTCGHTSRTPFAQYDHEQRCWKTSEATSLWALPLSSLTLPTWGCLHAGELYELPTPALPTIERDCLSLPTPQARDWKDKGLPKPHGLHSPSLPVMLGKLLPTPAVNDMGAGKDPEAWQEWAARQKAADGRSAPHGKSLEQEALQVGVITPQPSPVGSASLDDPHQPQLFTLGTAHA
jgi:hypothetical protein